MNVLSNQIKSKSKCVCIPETKLQLREEVNNMELEPENYVKIVRMHLSFTLELATAADNDCDASHLRDQDPGEGQRGQQYQDCDGECESRGLLFIRS